MPAAMADVAVMFVPLMLPVTERSSAMVTALFESEMSPSTFKVDPKSTAPLASNVVTVVAPVTSNV